MNIKVFVVLLLFAACCRLEADPSEGLKDLLHKLAVKNSGMEYKATWLTFSLFWLPLYKDIFSESKVPHPVHNITAIRSGSELKDVRSGGWSVATPATAFLLLGSAVYICTLCFLCLWSPRWSLLTCRAFSSDFSCGIYFLFSIQLMFEQRMGLRTQEIRFGN